MDTPDPDAPQETSPHRCAFRYEDDEQCGGFRVRGGDLCIGHSRGARPHSTVPKLTPTRILKRCLGDIWRELSRLKETEREVTEKLSAVEDSDERIGLLKFLSTLAGRRSEITSQMADLEDKRMRNLIAAIVAGGKVGYEAEDLKKLIATGGNGISG